MSDLASADLVAAFRQVLELCGVHPGENVLVFTDPRFPHPHYPPAAFAAARSLGASAYLMVSQGDQTLDDRLVTSTWRSADVVLGMSTLPRGLGSWMYTETSNDALRARTRILMVQEPFEVLKRMMPEESIRRRGMAGARRLDQAKEMRFVSRGGSDFTVRKDGRKGSFQCGVADEPGSWDHWPSGMVYCAPLEDSAEGVYVIQPGDVLLGFWRHAQSTVTLTLEKGRITKVEGGPDAYLLREHIARVGDDGAFRLSHAGWGTDPRADWSHVGMDSESLYGTTLVALGRNVFDTPARHRGLGGVNDSRLHFDICCRNVDLFLDGEPVIRNERFLLKELE